MSSTAPTPSPSPSQSPSQSPGAAPSAQTQALIDAAKAPVTAYGDKNWMAVRASIAPDCSYDEVATSRKMQGPEAIVACWQGWAAAMPDSKATIHQALASGTMVMLEVTWRGTHTGPLELPTGMVPATNRTIELRACQVCEIADGKPRMMRQYFDIATMFRQLGIAK